ncbi:MAG: 3-hydroxyacyl-CoA dehydrogenase NAD-binding domain-containing protein, partial [Acidimicrobiia bacterium]
MTNGIERVGVVGCGLMGSGIAEVCARAGLDVVVREVNQPSLDAGRKRVEGSLDRAVKAGKLDAAGRDAAMAQIRFTTDFGDLADRQLVVEAVIENEAEKLEVFASLDKAVQDEDAVLASNTSSIPVMKLAMATHRPANVLGLHFFNPVPVMHLVELIPSLLTSQETSERAEAFAGSVLQKRVIRSKDRAG